ncbi:MAG TPA: sulfatase [Vicinamibacterales bacterium]|nr:sulfatase [Vicinamibacterales bacterium]
MAAALLVVFLAAKATALAGHHVPLSWWTPVAFVWEDAIVVLAFALVAKAVPRIAGPAYAILAAYAAINVPVTRVVSTPLTWSMWRAARGPLADSIRLYLTPASVAMILTVCAIAAIAPRLLRGLRRTAVHGMYAALVVCAALGPVSASRVDTVGFERNAWMALATTTLPRLSANGAAAEWAATGFDLSRHDELAGFRGAAAGRNIVFVSLESTAAQYLGVYGADPDVMPNLSALAQSAIVFDRAYAVYPESIKGLYSTLCSAYPALDRVADAYADVPCRSIAAVLSAHGYRTAPFHSGRFAYLGMEAIVRHRGYDLLADAGDLGGRRESSFGVDEPSTVAHILKWIDALPRGRKFFVTYLPIAGHHPYDTPDSSSRGPFSDRDDFGRYRNAIYYGDAALGALVDGVAARGLADRTLWIVIGDHGEAFGQHEGNFGHTFQIYDENVHVPLLVAAPGLWTRQTRSPRVVSSIDAAPTLLDLAGIDAPHDYQGRSALDGEARLALFFADYSHNLVGLRDGSMKFIDDLDSGRGRLFDLDRDPSEARDVSSRFPDRARWYRRNLRAWSASQRARLDGATNGR